MLIYERVFEIIGIVAVAVLILYILKKLFTTYSDMYFLKTFIINRYENYPIDSRCEAEWKILNKHKEITVNDIPQLVNEMRQSFMSGRY